ncbi:MAG: hypothetical protein Q4B70_12625, partial [Lachnospiraceae bacterium]|nr:hypothetical protein [Lachnospiraceae bacterium]
DIEKSTNDNEGDYYHFIGEEERENVEDGQIMSRKSYSKGDLVYTKTSQAGVLYQEKAYFDSKTKQSKKFIRYLTDAWAKASSYTYKKSVSVGVTVDLSGEKSFAKKVIAKLGLAVSASKSFEIGISIPADKTKYSKLSLLNDQYKVIYKHKYYEGDKLTKTTKVTAYSPTKDFYLTPRYQ